MIYRATQLCMYFLEQHDHQPPVCNSRGHQYQSNRHLASLHFWASLHCKQQVYKPTYLFLLMQGRVPHMSALLYLYRELSCSSPASGTALTNRKHLSVSTTEMRRLRFLISVNCRRQPCLLIYLLLSTSHIAGLTFEAPNTRG